MGGYGLGRGGDEKYTSTQAAGGNKPERGESMVSIRPKPATQPRHQKYGTVGESGSLDGDKQVRTQAADTVGAADPP